MLSFTERSSGLKDQAIRLINGTTRLGDRIASRIQTGMQALLKEY